VPSESREFHHRRHGGAQHGPRPDPGARDPLEHVGPDNVFGAGRADAFATLKATLPLRKGAATLTVDENTTFGATLTPGQLGFTDPNQCPLTALKWVGGGTSGRA
jgi:hypothetical protein